MCNAAPFGVFGGRLVRVARGEPEGAVVIRRPTERRWERH